MQDTIPLEKTEAVTRALRSAFGVIGFESIRRITRGHSPGVFVFRIDMDGRPFLLRIITRTDDPTRHFAAMTAAAEAGLAPHVWYTNVEDSISITDFIAAVPFPAADALVRMAATLRTLHALPPFPGKNSFNTTCTFLLDKGPALDGFLSRFQAVNILSKNESDALFARYAQLAVAYPPHNPYRRSGDMVSSHNDLFKPDNILFDGSRVWLVDWEAAFVNDRYADLAVVANQIVTNDAEEAVYLHEYFGKPPDEYQRARFFLMQQLAYIFYTMAFLFAGYSAEPPERNENPPEYGDFQRRFWTGEITLDDKPTKIVYARVLLAKLIEDTSQARFSDALKIVSTAR